MKTDHSAFTPSEAERYAEDREYDFAAENRFFWRVFWASIGTALMLIGGLGSLAILALS